MNRMPQVGDLVIVKLRVMLVDLRGKKLKVVYVDKKQSMIDKHIWFEIGLTLNGTGYVVTDCDIEKIIGGKEKVTFT